MWPGIAGLDELVLMHCWQVCKILSYLVLTSHLYLKSHLYFLSFFIFSILPIHLEQNLNLKSQVAFWTSVSESSKAYSSIWFKLLIFPPPNLLIFMAVSRPSIALFPNDVTAHLIIASCPDVSDKLHQYNCYKDVPGAKIAYPSVTDNSLSSQEVAGM